MAAGDKPAGTELRLVGGLLTAAGAAATQVMCTIQAPGGEPEAHRPWQVNSEILLAALAALSLVLVLWWARGRQLEAQRRIIKALFRLGEEVIGSASPAEILRQMRAVLPPLLRVSGIRLYVFNRAGNSLEEVAPDPGTPPVSISLERPQGLVAKAAAACFRNQVLLAIPNARRSPFLRGETEAERIRALMLVPVVAQGELRGVLELHDLERVRSFSVDEELMAQHLANQAAIALRWMEEQTVHEQLSRTERLVAAGQLLSGVAGELRAPLESIVRLTGSFLHRGHGPLTEEQMRAIALEAEKAADILTRLESFSQPERGPAKPVDLGELLRNLLEFRRHAWASCGVDVREQIGHEPVWVLGSRGQLERVFLNLLMHAEQAVADSPEKRLAVSLAVLGRRALVEIAYNAAAPQARSPEDRVEASVPFEGVVRGIVQSHGGETRLVRLPDSSSRMEVELPLAPDRIAARPGLMGEGFTPRLSTVLVVEPDPAAREKLVSLLGRRGYRVVPISSAEQGVDLAQRLHFDLVFCAAQLPGLNWIEFLENLRARISAFILVTQGYDPELARGFPGQELYLLPRPIVESELERLLISLESGLPPGSAARPGE